MSLAPNPAWADTVASDALKGAVQAEATRLDRAERAEAWGDPLSLRLRNGLRYLLEAGAEKLGVKQSALLRLAIEAFGRAVVDGDTRLLRWWAARFESEKGGVALGKVDAAPDAIAARSPASAARVVAQNGPRASSPGKSPLWGFPRNRPGAKCGA